MTNTRNTYIPHLDVLRWIAAMMIILLHAYEAYCGWWGQISLLSNGTKTALSSWGKVIDQFIRNFLSVI